MTNERDRVPCAREIAGDQFPHRDEASVTEAASDNIGIDSRSGRVRRAAFARR